MTPSLTVIALIVGLLFVLTGRSTRRSRGLGQGRTLSLDNRAFYSARLKLTGRPDRIVSENGMLIPEEWKSGNRVYDAHKVQMGSYFILIEEETGIRPTHGFIVLGNQERVRIENTAELREWMLRVADEIREVRREIVREIEVRQPPGKCRTCGVREWCGQRSG